MTVQEAKGAINRCESEISIAHADLCKEATRLGNNAFEKASMDKTKSFWLLIISFVGIVFCIFNAWFIGVCLIIGGIIGAYLVHSSASAVAGKVESALRQLTSTINNNRKI
ncbi:MAG: hypothetical protein LUE20_04460 [Oscillospiraceae bacterium]|nr:hypothetical protein [Oscillospiraceae bacterium]